MNSWIAPNLFHFMTHQNCKMFSAKPAKAWRKLCCQLLSGQKSDHNLVRLHLKLKKTKRNGFDASLLQILIQISSKSGHKILDLHHPSLSHTHTCGHRSGPEPSLPSTTYRYILWPLIWIWILPSTTIHTYWGHWSGSESSLSLQHTHTHTCGIDLDLDHAQGFFTDIIVTFCPTWAAISSQEKLMECAWTK